MSWLTPELVSSITALLAALAAVLAWAAKLWWGKEHANAKDEIIKAKDSQIAALEREIKSLNELTPMKLREYFVSVKEQLEEYNDNLHKQLNEAKNDLQRADAQIKVLTTEGVATAGEIESLQMERDELRTVVAALEAQRRSVQSQQHDLEATEHTLSPRQRQIYSYIESFLQENGYPPAIRNIQSDLKISSTSVVAYNLKKLEERGLLSRDAKFARGMKLPATDEDEKLN